MRIGQMAISNCVLTGV